MFLAKKREVAEKLNQRKQHTVDQDDQVEYQSVSTTAGKKKDKTKEELFELRKAMMKSSLKRKADNFSGAVD